MHARLLWYCTGSLTRRTIWDTAIRLDIKGFHMPLKACAYRKKGMLLLPRGIERYYQFIRGVCGTNTRAFY